MDKNKNAISKASKRDIQKSSSSLVNRGIDLSNQLSTVANPFKNIREIFKLSLSDKSPVFCFSPQGNYLFIIDHNQILLWDVKTKEEIWLSSTLGKNGPTSGKSPAFCFSPQGNYLLVVDHNQILLWDVNTKEETWLSSTLGKIGPTAISQNERYIAAGFESGQILIWDLKSRELISTIELDEKLVHFGNNYKIEEFDADSIILWDLSSKEEKGYEFKRLINFPTAMCFSKDGTVLIAGYVDGELLKWDVKSRCIVQNIKFLKDATRLRRLSSFAVVPWRLDLPTITSIYINPMDTILGISTKYANGVLFDFSDLTMHLNTGERIWKKDYGIWPDAPNRRVNPLINPQIYEYLYGEKSIDVDYFVVSRDGSTAVFVWLSENVIEFLKIPSMESLSRILLTSPDFEYPPPIDKPVIALEIALQYARGNTGELVELSRDTQPVQDTDEFTEFAINGIRLSEDGRTCVGISSFGDLILIDNPSNPSAYIYSGNSKEILKFDYSSKNQMIAAAVDDEIVVWAY